MRPLRLPALALLVLAPLSMCALSAVPAAAGAPEDPNQAFRARYEASGAPRVMVFWNVSFNDQTQSASRQVEITRDIAPGEMREEGGASGPGQVHMTTSQTIDPAKRHARLSERDAARLETAFREGLRGAGVRLIDRATSVRFMAADRDRNGGDPKLIETDAVRANTEVLLEVLLVRDFMSPLGRGFIVRAIDVSDGAEVAQVYTLAMPALPAPQGHYELTDDGFRWQSAPPQIPAPEQIGTTLANEVLTALEPVLPHIHTRGRN